MTDFLDLVQSLQLAIKARVMYTRSHPRARTALEVLAGQMEGWLASEPVLRIASSQGRLFLDGAIVEAKHPHLANLARLLGERQISGMVFLQGVTAQELEDLLGVFTLKPSQVEEEGGAAALLARLNLPHVRLSQTQYKEVRQGDPGTVDLPGAPGILQRAADVNAVATAAALEALAASLRPAPGGEGAGPGQGSGAGAGGGHAAQAASVEALALQWRDQFALLPRRPLSGSGVEPANLAFLGGTAGALGMGEHFPPATQVEGLRRALLGLSPEQALSVVAGLDTLPPGHHGLRLGFQALAAEAFSRAGAALVAGGAPWEQTREVLYESVRYAPQAHAMITALERELRGRGVGPEQVARLRELIQQLDWENQTMEEKLRQSLEQDKLWSLSLDQRLRFLRRLLEEGRSDGFLQVMEVLLGALRKDPAGQREMAAKTLTGVTRWLADPGLPPGAEASLTRALAGHFAGEPLLHIHRATTESLGVLLAHHVHRGAPTRAMALLRELADQVARQDPPLDWRRAGLAKLGERLADPVLLRKAAELLHSATPEILAGELVPFFNAMGQPAGQTLMELLGEEPDRKRRGRLLETIRAMGLGALPAIQEGLASNTWYLVRNALNLLGEIGDLTSMNQAVPCLDHPDGRVKLAAARALYKVGGAAAVPVLVGAFPTVNPETQEEILFGLGQLRAAQALQALSAYALDKRNPDRLRARTAETIGQIGDTRAIPVLTELVRRRGRIFTSAEPLEVRLAACRALMALDNVGATEALAHLVAAEPWHKDRTALQQVLDSRRLP